MSNILGLKGFNPSSGTARLFAAYGNDINNVATGTGYGLNLNGNDVEFENFLDRVFFQNNSATPKSYRTSTNVWTQEFVGRTPISKYIKRYKSRLYLGYCSFPSPQAPLDVDSNALSFPSRVFHSDLFQGNVLTWGIEWGTNGKTTGGTQIFSLDQPLVQDFKAVNIKVGDPLFITSGNTQLASEKPYLVTKVDSPHRLIVDRPFPVTASSLHFWVGSNWFDADNDDGDVITGLGENSDRLMIYKLLALHWYNGSQRKKVKGAKGTSYNRSVIDDDYGNSYYFHGSSPKLTGIYKYDGVSSKKISKPIDPFIQGMSTTNYDNVVAWKEGTEIRFYLGNLSATNLIESMTNAVATYNVDTGAFSVDAIADVITASTVWRTNNQEDTYLGTSDDEILQVEDVYTFNTSAISSVLETKVYYPAGSEVICEIPYIQVISRNARGVRLQYKLWNHPEEIDSTWSPLGDINEDKTEFTLPITHYSSSGIQLKFDEVGTTENDWYIEKISIFYRPERSRIR